MTRSEPPPEQQRMAERIEAAWAVDCETEDTFLFASIANISQLGIFVRTDDPLAIGTVLRLHFAAPGLPPFSLAGQVQWVNTVRLFGENLNPGMGIKFLELQHDDRERLVAAIRTIAYLRGDPELINPN